MKYPIYVAGIMRYKKPIFNTDKSIRRQYLLDVLNYILSETRHDLKWLMGEALESFDRKYWLAACKESYKGKERKRQLRNATQLYYLHQPYDHDCWNECFSKDNWIIYHAMKFRETLDKYINALSSDNTLDEVFKYKNPYKVLEMYCRAVLAYPTDSAVYVMGSVVISNPEFLPDAVIDIFDESSLPEFHKKLSPLYNWLRLLDHYNKISCKVDNK